LAERNLLLLVTLASDLRQHTIKLSSLHWRVAISVPWTDVHRNCDTLLHRWPSIIVYRTLHQSSIDSQILTEIAIYAYPTCIRRPRYGVGSRRNITTKFSTKKTIKWFGYQTVKTFW